MINSLVQLMRITLYFLFLTFILPSVAAAQDNLVLKEIRFVFEYKDVEGTIEDFRSASRIDLKDIENSYFEGSVGVSSLKTGNFLRDWALKGRKYFDEDEYPRIDFKSTEVTEQGTTILVKGLLTMKGKTKPLIIRFEKEGTGLVGKTELYTSDYDIAIKKERTENKVVVTLAFEVE